MAVIRTFISFDTPDPIKKEISTLQQKLKTSKADVKWESEDKFHATIKFLGNVNETILPTVISTTTSIVQAYPKLEIIYAHLGCFPNKRQPRVAWVGCTNPVGILLRLKNDLDKLLVQFGFEIEKRDFHPHITLGRVKSSKGIQNLIPMLENLNFEPRKALIDEIQIMKSVLKEEGSEYTVLKSIHLQG